MEQPTLSADTGENEYVPNVRKSASINAQAKLTDTVYEVNKDSDALMAVYCLLQDFLELRLTVRFTWHTLVNNVGVCSDLITAAAVTQGAFEIVHILAQALDEQYAEYSSMEDLLRLILKLSPVTSEDGSLKDTAEKAWSLEEKVEYKELTRLMPSTYHEKFQSANMVSAQNSCQIRARPLYQVEEEDIALLQESRAAMTPMLELDECLGHLKKIQETSSIDEEDLLSDSDSFTRLWYKATKADSGGLKPGLEQVLVTQLFLDVQTMMFRKNAVYHQNIEYIFQFLRGLQATQFDWRKEPHPVPFPEGSLAAHPHTSRDASDIPSSTMLAMNAYFATNPVWAGLHMLYRVAGYQLDDIDLKATQYGLIPVAHLYNALAELHHSAASEGSKLLEQAWDDMETFMSLVGIQKVFVTSEQPTILKDCSNRARLAMGAKASDFTMNKRTTKVKAKSQHRGFQIGLPMLRALMENYTTKCDGSGNTRIGFFSSNVMDAMVTVFRSGRREGTHEQIKDDLSKMSLMYYLMMFRLFLQVELSHCFFDYGSLALRCYGALEDVATVLKSDLNQEGRAAISPNLVYDVPVVLLAEEERIVNRSRQKLSPDEVLSLRMKRIADMISKHCEKAEGVPLRGNMGIQRMLEYCRVLRIPPPMSLQRPSFGPVDDQVLAGVYQEMMTGNTPKLSEEEQEKWENYWKTVVAEAKRDYELGNFEDCPTPDWMTHSDSK